MIAFLVTLLLASAIALFCLVVLEGRDVYLHHRSERVRIERQKRVAERRLHDISSRAFESMLDEARQSSSGSNRPLGS